MSDLGLSPLGDGASASQSDARRIPDQVAPGPVCLPDGEHGSIPEVELTPSTLIHDMRRDVIGVVMEVGPRWVFLRPVGVTPGSQSVLINVCNDRHPGD